MLRGFEAKNQPLPWHGGTGQNGALDYNKCTRADIHLHFNDLDNILIKSFRDNDFYSILLDWSKTDNKE